MDPVRKNDLVGKAVVFLADGMADDPIPELGGKTPLEAAETPYMDLIASTGASGTFLSLPEGFPTSSDAANMSVLGYSLAKYYPGRGPIEAASRELKLKADDVAWRCNLVTVENGILKDYSAGHIDGNHSRILMEDLQKHFGSEKVSFHPGVSYRNLMILHGSEFSADVGYFKPDSSQDEPVASLPWTPLKDTPEARHTAEFVTDLVRRCGEYLLGHPLVRSGAVRANGIWPWSPGRKPAFPAFSEKYGGRKGAVITAVDVISGIARCASMDVIPVEGATGYIDTNYAGKAEAAIRAIEDHDFVYVHLEAIDETSHEGRLDRKLQAIRDFDEKIVRPVMLALRKRGVTFAILPDHPVPLHLRKHTRTPVPVAVCGPHIKPDSVMRYSEADAPKGSLGALSGDQFMKTVLNIQENGKGK